MAPAPRAPAAPPRYSAPAIAGAGLVALAVAMGIGRFAFTPILPMMQEDAGLSVAAGGWLASANYFGYLAGALSAAMLPLRPAHAIRTGLLLIAVTTFAMGLARDPVAWTLWRFGAGVASAWVLVHVSAWSLAQLARRQRPRLSGVVYAGVGAGVAVAGAVCLLLMQFEVGSPRAWMTFGALSLALSLIVWRVFDNALAPAASATAAPAPKFTWRGERLRLVLCYGAFGFGYIIPATFLPAMAKAMIADPAIFGWSWPLFGTAAAASTLLAAPLQRHVGNRSLWIATHLLMAFGVALPAFVPGLGPVFAAALLVGGTFMVTTMVGLQEARSAAGPDATRLIAAMTAAFALGQILGPLAAAAAVWAGGTLGASLTVAALALLGGAAGLLPARRAADAPSRAKADSS